MMMLGVVREIAATTTLHSTLHLQEAHNRVQLLSSNHLDHVILKRLETVSMGLSQLQKSTPATCSYYFYENRSRTHDQAIQSCFHDTEKRNLKASNCIGLGR